MPNASTDHVGDFLRDHRLKRGLSIRAVSMHSGVPRTTLQDIESGKNKPGFDTLISLMEFYNVRFEELYPPAASFGTAQPVSVANEHQFASQQATE